MIGVKELESTLRGSTSVPEIIDAVDRAIRTICPSDAKSNKEIISAHANNADMVNLLLEKVISEDAKENLGIPHDAHLQLVEAIADNIPLSAHYLANLYRIFLKRSRAGDLPENDRERLINQIDASALTFYSKTKSEKHSDKLFLLNACSIISKKSAYNVMEIMRKAEGNNMEMVSLFFESILHKNLRVELGSDLPSEKDLVQFITEYASNLQFGENDKLSPIGEINAVEMAISLNAKDIYFKIIGSKATPRHVGIVLLGILKFGDEGHSELVEEIKSRASKNAQCNDFAILHSSLVEGVDPLKEGILIDKDDSFDLIATSLNKKMQKI